MAKQVTNYVSIIKLPDGQYIQIGRKPLKEFFRVHFPGSRSTDDLDDGQGQLNLDVCGGRIGETGTWQRMNSIN
jgi:hypothetical protein